ncbi:transcriptional regulator, MerR family [Acidimicrobium ferrooxidans DSM 10331]|uniref:Transcriptional regulator, MerR family n=1 Tax=Acidimicrobium ferrooxidans (strain DSM 10331 / JCM 15462 / NBRC 103882 / ICP) TaxID=525909 RepID=C7LZA1_ACIFD|nr:MerR family transcriptional regulator [Acidimicrobium ferrooxidans]ACU54059.1 transcriptional regulator, MerR family [Acidimicrobium ferrooxidans DSM 10331]
MNSSQHLRIVPEPEYSIKDVLALLQEEFPEVTISKIRFLESQGLISPERTPSGYRRFYDHDIARLRHVLRLQKSTYMPLKKIKEHLDAGTQPSDLFSEDAVAGQGNAETSAVTPNESEPEAGSSAEASRSDAPGLLDEHDALARAGANASTLRAALDHGMIVGITKGRERYLTLEEVEILALLASLERHGLEPRHLRFVRSFAEREVGLIEQVLAPVLSMSHRHPERARTAIAELAELLGALTTALTTRDLERLDPHARRTL